MKNLLCIVLFFFSLKGLAQEISVDKAALKRNQVVNDTMRSSNKSTSNKNIKNQDATIDLYKIISFENDTTIVDTSLTIKKEYKFNYLRKDNFELLNFSNLGQTYNTLSSNFYSERTMPLFGARARHFNYMQIEDINYYHVPTPFTELLYKSAFEQGQLLDAFFTVNTSEQLNFSIAYKGLRSLGKYQHILTSTGNFRFTTNYTTKNRRYKVRAHIVMQDLLNQENGGLQDEDLVNFETGDEEFLDRSVFDPNFENAESILEGKRFHLEHQYQITKAQDSLANNTLIIGNNISFEDKYYQFTQTTQNDYFGDAFLSSNINDKVTLEDFYNRFYASYHNKDIGHLRLNLDYNNFNYGYDTVVFLDDNSITNRIKGDVLSVGGAYNKSFNKFSIEGELGVNVSGDFEGNFFKAKASYKINDNTKALGTFNSSSRAPNYNFQLYQSDYLNYNWDNTSLFKNINTQQIAFQLQSKKIANLSFDYTIIDNYTYFQKETDTTFVKPYQANSSINYFRLKLNKEIKYGKFALDNTIMYQEVLNGENILNVPKIITRNTLYYSNHFFKKALYLQTGVIFNYFSEYNMNAYDPVLAEFYVQNNTKIGNFPRLDFFINAKVRQTRIYLKAEHFNSAWTGYNYYSAPNYPYRDFTVRFGIVWNFFL
ncbi:hypothetical protein EVU94_10225 [Flavobacteriaceae bacterium 144Ye]|nr:hypothetical protein EVU94_10225 [Flavobacteriaceae bacterium 144Ye]